jgi:hypothetical protein
MSRVVGRSPHEFVRDAAASAREGRPPVIILGAARSGTKLLRRLVAASGCYAEIPFDVNYIWRFGNESCRHDVLTPDMLREKTRRFVRTRLEKIAVHAATASTASVRQTATNADPLPFVEKTVSNVLRAPYVKAIYPAAKYIALVRDGRDVAESAARCWREPPEAGYLLAKLRTFPWLRCAPYGAKYALNVARRKLGLDRHLRTWGPRYPGIDDDVRRLSVLEVCARQWVASIEHYDRARPLFAADEMLEVRYEELVQETPRVIDDLCKFLSIDNRHAILDYARQTIQADRLGTRCRLSPRELRQVLEIARSALERWGYLGHSTNRRVA